MVPQFLGSMCAYPDTLPEVRSPGNPVTITVTLVAGPDRAVAEESLNSFIRACTDIDRVDRFVVLDEGLSRADRAVLSGLYPFLEILPGIVPPQQ